MARYRDSTRPGTTTRIHVGIVSKFTLFLHARDNALAVPYQALENADDLMLYDILDRDLGYMGMGYREWNTKMRRPSFSMEGRLQLLFFF